MSWTCSVCQEKFSRKDSMRRHRSHKHSESRSFTSFKAVPFSPEKCQRFHFVHPFTCMVAGMTGSGKTVWVKSLLQQAQRAISLPPETIVWCYSQWQPAYLESMTTIPNIEFVKGIPENLEKDAGNEKRIVNLFTKGSHHRNLSVIIYIVQNLFHLKEKVTETSA